VRGAIVLLAGPAFTASADAVPLFGANDYGTTVVVHL